jgi:hypothetical protein
MQGQQTATGRRREAGQPASIQIRTAAACWVGCSQRRQSLWSHLHLAHRHVPNGLRFVPMPAAMHACGKCGVRDRDAIGHGGMGGGDLVAS